MVDLVVAEAEWTTPPGTDLQLSAANVEACTSTTWLLQQPIEACLSTTWRLVNPVEACTQTDWILQQSIEACTSTTWTLEEPIEACTSTTWTLQGPIEACTSTTWLMGEPIEACISTTWELSEPPVEACTQTQWLMTDTSVESCTNTSWKHANPVEQCNPISYWPQSFERIDACTSTRMFLGQDLAALKQTNVGNLRLVDGMNEIPLDAESFSVRGSQGAHTFTLSAKFLEQIVWNQLEERCSEVRVDVAGVTYQFLIESKSKTIARTSCTYTATGTSPTVRLTKAYADDICKDYSGILLSVAMAEIAGTGGFSLDFRIEDVLIPSGALVIKQTSPMDALISIARRMGAIVQTNPAGDTIIIEYPYKVAVTQYAAQTGVNVVAAETNLLSYGSRWKPTENFDSVIVSATAEQPVKTVYNIEYRPSEQRVRVTTVPDVDVQPDLKVGSFNSWILTPLGAQSEFVSECIELKDGSGNLTGNPEGGFVVLDYVNGSQSIFGQLSISCNTITNSDTSFARTALVQASYDAKYWEYSLTTLSTDPESKIVLYIE